MITSGYAARVTPAVERRDPERPSGAALASPGREADAAACNEALRVLAPHVDEQTLKDVRRALIKSGVIYVARDGE